MSIYIRDPLRKPALRLLVDAHTNRSVNIINNRSFLWAVPF